MQCSNLKYQTTCNTPKLAACSMPNAAAQGHSVLYKSSASSLCRLPSMNSLRVCHQDSDVYITWQPASTKADMPSSRPSCCCTDEHQQALHLFLRSNPQWKSTVQDLPAGSAICSTRADWAHLHIGMQTNSSFSWQACAGTGVSLQVASSPGSTCMCNQRRRVSTEVLPSRMMSPCRQQ